MARTSTWCTQVLLAEQYAILRWGDQGFRQARKIELLRLAREAHEDCFKGWLGYYDDGKPAPVMRDTRFQAVN